MGDYKYPAWGEALGFMISLSSMLWVPGKTKTISFQSYSINIIHGANLLLQISKNNMLQDMPSTSSSQHGALGRRCWGWGWPPWSRRGQRPCWPRSSTTQRGLVSSKTLSWVYWTLPLLRRCQVPQRRGAIFSAKSWEKRRRRGQVAEEGERRA